jgi:putative MATE family efflux protein
MRQKGLTPLEHPPTRPAMPAILSAVTTRVPDRRIFALALPALGSLAAEPLYLLVDTAVIGHLGKESLAGLAVGAALLGNAIWLMNFLAYGTTSRASRLFGAGRRHEAVERGVQATWLGAIVGVLLLIVLQAFADPLTRLIAGDHPETQAAALGWLRVALFGVPFVTIVLAGCGWLRGVQELRKPLFYLIASNIVSAALAPLLVYGFDMGLNGSAYANVVGQIFAAALFLQALVRERVSLRPYRQGMIEQLGAARDLGIRTIALEATFLSATAVASRLGPEQVAAHLIAIQLWYFLALTLDAFAIAAQALIGELLGADEIVAARATARRLCELGAIVGAIFGGIILAGWRIIPRLFTNDEDVVQATGAAWIWFGGMQPIAGVVFAIDGILVGAGDTAFMRNFTLVAVLCGYLPCMLGTIYLDWGLTGLWVGITLFILIRFVLGGTRTLRGAWAIGGATT